MRRRKLFLDAGGWLLLICLPLALASPVRAQDTGQVCAQSFIDRDADGSRGLDEPMATRGVSASLQNAAGVTIASLLLDDSPLAADGLLCFGDLLAGDYQITLRSSEFASTTAAAFSASVRPGAAPMVVQFGLQPLPDYALSRSPADKASALNAVLPLLIGGAVLVASLCAAGFLTALLIFRRRSVSAPARLHHAPIGGETSANPPLKHDSSAGSPPLYAADDIDAPRAN